MAIYAVLHHSAGTRDSRTAPSWKGWPPEEVSARCSEPRQLAADALGELSSRDWGNLASEKGRGDSTTPRREKALPDKGGGEGRGDEDEAIRVPALSKESASSFPTRSQWLGTHWRLTETPEEERERTKGKRENGEGDLSERRRGRWWKSGSPKGDGWRGRHKRNGETHTTENTVG